MIIGASSVTRKGITFYGYTDDRQVNLTFYLTLDEVIELCHLLDGAADVMRNLKPDEEQVMPPGLGLLRRDS